MHENLVGISAMQFEYKEISRTIDRLLAQNFVAS